ncbi:hypothetical protein B7494_g1599 [Chlorociboria aeruginascens]|nr:hypothetical protein B7494_g1599 [Chlorociboria aeruginascens]
MRAFTRIGASSFFCFLSLLIIVILLPKNHVSTKFQKIALGTTIDGYTNFWDWASGKPRIEGNVGLVVFGDSWVDGDGFKDAVDIGWGKTWTDVLCEEIKCTSNQNLAVSQPSTAYPAEAPTGALAANHLYVSAITTTQESAEHMAAKMLPDFGAQIQSFIALPVPEPRPKEILFVVSFGMWEIYHFSALDYTVAQSLIDQTLTELFTQLDILYAHYTKTILTIHKIQIAESRANGTAIPPPPKFRVIIPKLFDPTLVPGWISRRPSPLRPSSIAEHQKNAVYLTGSWNTLLENKMRAWIKPNPNKSSDTQGDDTQANNTETEIQPGKDFFYYDLSKYLTDIIIEHQLEEQGLSDASGLGTHESPFESVYKPCVREADDDFDDDAVDIGGRLICKDPDEYLFWDDFSLGSIPRDEIGDKAVNIGHKIKGIERIEQGNRKNNPIHVLLITTSTSLISPRLTPSEAKGTPRSTHPVRSNQEPQGLSITEVRVAETFSQQSAGKKSLIEQWEKGAIYPRSARYYGPTSFSAVFSEHKSKLPGDLLDIGEEGRKHPSTWPFGQPLLGRERPTAPTVRANKIIKALYNIPPREMCEDLLSTYKSYHNLSLNEFMIRHAITNLYSSFGEELAEPRTNEKFEKVVLVLFKNEETPLPPPPDDGIEWLNTFTGPNLRMEMLGLLFCFFDTLNELVAALLINIRGLEGSIIGQESYVLRRRHGHMITACIAAGLHRLPSYDHNRYMITAASEYRRRVFAVAFHGDKFHASLNGVPPGLSQKYCNIRMPLDLGENELFLPREELIQAIEKLEDKGWNTEGKMNPITVTRAIWSLDPVWEEVLELSLGVNAVITSSRIDELHQKCYQTLSELPEQLKYYSNRDVLMDSTGKELYSRACLLLEFLQIRFLIDRVAVARGLANGQGLLDTAMEMMEITTMFWIKRDQLTIFNSNFDFLIVSYGVPSAGVICIELLKQSRTPSESYLKFSRSDAIQKLTMFVGFLEWIRPTDGNYALALRLRTVVRRILDHVLDPPLEEVIRENNEMNISFDPMLALDEMDANMGWLNTVDWTQGPWMEFEPEI